MKRTKRTVALTFLTCLSLLISLTSGIMLNDRASAASKQAGRRGDKVASELRRRVWDSHSPDESMSVILQLNGPASGPLKTLLKRNGVHVNKSFSNFNSHAIELPSSVVDELAAYDEVQVLSLDDEVKSFGHITSTTGADDVRAQTGYTLDGSGIGIAILDSGMYSAHKMFGTRIVYNKDFTGQERVDDPYGHGTHVATAAAGNGTLYSGSYTGIAPNSNLINLRVLNSLGIGKTSGVLAALDWVMSNRSTYNIRVVNMSIGTAAVSSYQNDPLCQAVRDLVDAGVVVVAAAGNTGKDAFGRKIYGAIHSPGNEPSAITVGATNTFGTDARSDDGVATYSSRGPTRSYWTDTSGIRHYDNVIKPDLVAPGNKLIFAEAQNNLIVTTFPSLDSGLGAGKTSQKMMYLSGTSISAPIVAGAAALLLQANPKLTPNMVKMILMYTAQQLPNFNMFEQGAGQVNIEGAVRLAKLVRTDLTSTTAIGASLLTTTAPTAQSTVDGTTFSWAQGIVMDQTYAKGTALITKYQKIYGLGVLLSDGTLLSNGVLISDQTMMSSGVLLGTNIMTSNGVLLGDGTVFCATGVLLGDGVLLSDGVLLGDGVLLSDGTLLGAGVLLSDYVAPQSVLANGDLTAFMR